MTRSEIKRQVRLLGQHYFNSALDLDPFGLDLLVNETANDVARKTDCFIGRRYLDLVANTDEYCASDLYRLKNIFVSDTLGEYKRLMLVEWYEGDNERYRRDGSTTYPTHAMVFGMNRMRLWPTPITNLTNGVMIEGYGIPGDVWTYDVNGDPSTTPADQQECPLPPIAHDCVVYGVLYKKAMQQRDMEMIPYYKEEYEQRLGMVESFASTFARRAT
jgi:hypothetical protein